MFFTRSSCAVRTGKSGILFCIPLFFLRRVCYNGASIMKKVHSAGFRPVAFVHFCHHTPQGDVGSCARTAYSDGSVYHHTPQGDVGFCDVDFKTQLTTIMITPRKGTLEITSSTTKYLRPPFVITPRKGTLDLTNMSAIT